jgi:7-keto-8-aminopelargonate synthetase-like enzyme
LRVYRHDDLDGLERDLARQTAARRRWIVTDSVFSMDGDVAPLPELCTLAERYGTELLVDEAHGTGVFGATGRGVAEWQQVEPRIVVRIGTLSKALGCLGGFVTGPQDLIDYLWNTARTQMFSTALPPAVCAAAIAALEIIRQQPQLVALLQARSALLRNMLMMRDVSISDRVCGPIVPVVVGDASRTMQIAAELERRGFLVGAIRPPTVPNGTARLRITVTLAHDETALTELADAVATVLHP